MLKMSVCVYVYIYLVSSLIMSVVLVLTILHGSKKTRSNDHIKHLDLKTELEESRARAEKNVDVLTNIMGRLSYTADDVDFVDKHDNLDSEVRNMIRHENEMNSAIRSRIDHLSLKNNSALGENITTLTVIGAGMFAVGFLLQLITIAMK